MLLCISLRCARCCVVHVAALCTLLRRKFRHAGWGGSAPPDPPGRNHDLSAVVHLPVLCNSLCCAPPCVVHLPVLCNSLCYASPCVVHLPVLCISLCCATPCVVQLHVLCNSLCCATSCVVQLPVLCYSKITFPFLEPFPPFSCPNRKILYKFVSNFGTHDKLEEIGHELKIFLGVAKLA